MSQLSDFKADARSFAAQFARFLALEPELQGTAAWSRYKQLADQGRVLVQVIATATGAYDTAQRLATMLTGKPDSLSAWTDALIGQVIERPAIDNLAQTGIIAAAQTLLNSWRVRELAFKNQLRALTGRTSVPGAGAELEQAATVFKSQLGGLCHAAAQRLLA